MSATPQPARNLAQPFRLRRAAAAERNPATCPLESGRNRLRPPSRARHSTPKVATTGFAPLALRYADCRLGSKMRCRDVL
jgi:hypothetical protein